jgi:hypothetical protein
VPDYHLAAGAWVYPIDRVAVVYHEQRPAGTTVWCAQISTAPDSQHFGEPVAPPVSVDLVAPTTAGYSGASYGNGAGRVDAVFAYADDFLLGRIRVFSVNGVDGSRSPVATVATGFSGLFGGGPTTRIDATVNPVVCSTNGRTIGSTPVMLAYVENVVTGSVTRAQVRIGLLSQTDGVWRFTPTAVVAGADAASVSRINLNLAAAFNPHDRYWLVAWHTTGAAAGFVGGIVSARVSVDGRAPAVPVRLVDYPTENAWATGVVLAYNAETRRFIMTGDHDTFRCDTPSAPDCYFAGLPDIDSLTGGGIRALAPNYEAGFEFRTGLGISGVSCRASADPCSPLGYCANISSLLPVEVDPPPEGLTGHCRRRGDGPEVSLAQLNSSPFVPISDPAVWTRDPFWIWQDDGVRVATGVHQLVRVPRSEIVVAVFEVATVAAKQMLYSFLPERSSGAWDDL